MACTSAYANEERWHDAQVTHYLCVQVIVKFMKNIVARTAALYIIAVSCLFNVITFIWGVAKNFCSFDTGYSDEITHDP